MTDRAAREGAYLAGNRRIRIPPHPHAVDRLLALLDACGVEPVADLRLYVDARDREAAAAAREAAGLPPRFLAVAPTARWGCKRWPLERFAAVAAGVAAAGTAVVGLFGPADREAKIAFEATVRGSAGGGAGGAGEVGGAESAGHAAPVIALAPEGVGGLLAHLEAAAGLLGNDSAALHLAVGLGTPTVSLFGPTDPAEVGPWTGGQPAATHVVIRTPDPPAAAAYRRLGDDDTHMRAIPETAVRQAVERILEAPPRPAPAAPGGGP